MLNPVSILLKSSWEKHLSNQEPRDGQFWARPQEGRSVHHLSPQESQQLSAVPQTQDAYQSDWACHSSTWGCIRKCSIHTCEPIVIRTLRRPVSLQFHGCNFWSLQRDPPPTSPDIMRGPSFTCPSRKHYVNSRIVYPCPTSPSFNSLYQSPLFPALLYPQSSFPTFFLLSQPSVRGITTSLRAIHLMRNVLIMCAQCRWPTEHFHCLHGNPPPATSPSPPAGRMIVGSGIMRAGGS